MIRTKRVFGRDVKKDTHERLKYKLSLKSSPLTHFQLIVTNIIDVELNRSILHSNGMDFGTITVYN